MMPGRVDQPRQRLPLAFGQRADVGADVRRREARRHGAQLGVDMAVVFSCITAARG